MSPVLWVRIYGNKDNTLPTLFLNISIPHSDSECGMYAVFEMRKRPL